MARFYLHVHNAHGDAEDEEGTDAENLAQAHEIAIRGIRSLLGAELANGSVNLEGRIEIKDEAGRLVDSVSFKDAVQVIGG